MTAWCSRIASCSGSVSHEIDASAIGANKLYSLLVELFQASSQEHNQVYEKRSLQETLERHSVFYGFPSMLLFNELNVL